MAKLFFDSFSQRTTRVEEGLKTLTAEIEKLKIARDRSQISDIVLLERVQKLEGLLEESLTWIKRVADSVQPRLSHVESGTLPSARNPFELTEKEFPAPLQTIVIPSGEAGSLPSITTPTELQVLSLLAERGPMSAPEVGKAVGRSREHSARLMRKLFEEGYVRRDQSRIPFRYSLVDRVRQSFKKSGPKPEGQETMTVPQT